MQYKLYSSAETSADVDVTIIGIFQDENVAQALHAVAAETGLLKSELINNVAQAAVYEKFIGKSSQQLFLPTYDAAHSKKILLYGLGSSQSWNSSFTRKMAATSAKSLRANQAQNVIVVLRDVEKPAATAGGAGSGVAKHDDAGNDESTVSGKEDAGQSGKDAAEQSGKDTSKDSSKEPKESKSKDGKDKEKESAKGKPINFLKLSEEHATEHIRAFAEGWTLGNYSFKKYETSSDVKETADLETSFAFAGTALSHEQIDSQGRLGEIIAEATNNARRWIAEPPAYMTPTRLAEEAQAIANKHGLKCQIMDAHEIEKLGMGSFLGVAKGAKEPLKFIIMKYDAPNATKTVGIIGKGITFDSGGLSLKPATSMEHMKYDMSGAAAIIAAMQVVGERKPSVSVLGLVAATENMPGSGALHPGDILTAMNGKTIEVNNTDAEGRLVLADAMTYAAQQGVDEMIDLATLTGAIVTALGRAAAGIMGNNQALIDNVIKYGARAGEKLWQMPMYDEYKDSLKSDVADLKNAGARGEAGSSAAAMFLQEFCGGKPWAHLDIAGPGWMEKPRDELNKGGTAFGVRTLCYYLLNL
jgi:leucyl aminopeptidase